MAKPIHPITSLYFKSTKYNMGKSIKIFVQNHLLDLENFWHFFMTLIVFWKPVNRKIVKGILVRHYHVFLRQEKTRKYVEEHKKGSCKQCGMCCQMIYRCRYLNENNTCSIYETRHTICHFFPTSQADCELIHHINPDKTCGFYFE